MKECRHKAFVGTCLGEDDVLRKARESGHHAARSKIQGIEKVYIPFYEFDFLVTFSNGSGPLSGLYRVDAVTLDCHLLPADLREERLIARRGGTLLPEGHSVEEGRTIVRKHIIDAIPRDRTGRGQTFNLTVEYLGRIYVPFWVAYYPGSRPGVFSFIVLDARTGDIDEAARESIDQGFLLLEEKNTAPPWF